MSDSLLPPRKKNARPGMTQVGLFLRCADGLVIEAVWNHADPDGKLACAAWDLLDLHGLHGETGEGEIKVKPATIDDAQPPTTDEEDPS